MVSKVINCPHKIKNIFPYGNVLVPNVGRLKDKIKQQNKLRIAHICPYYAPVICGVGQVVFELAQRQVKAGNEVHVFTSDWDKTERIEKEHEIINGVNVHRCYHYLKISEFSTIWPSVYKKLLAIKPDVIHSHITGHLHTYLAMKAAKKLGIPFVITPHCPWQSKRSLAGTIANWISYKFFPTLRYANAVIAITEWEHQFLLDEEVIKDKIHTIPNGMSTNFFKKIKPNKFKDKYNIPEDHKIVLFFGRLNYTKNPLMFLSIAGNILNWREEDVTFIVCGPDEGELKGVKEKINNFSKNIKKNIRLLPPNRDRKAIIEMYQASDIYVLPSRREGLPLTLFEAYASELPVVASAVNGIPYELKDNVNGFLLSSDNTKGFIEKVELLLDNDLTQFTMANNNREKAKGFNWDIINKKTMMIYKSTTFE